MKSLIVNFVLFAIGCILMIVSGCNGTPSGCENGWISNIGVAFCFVGLAFQPLASLTYYLINKLKKKK